MSCSKNAVSVSHSIQLLIHIPLLFLSLTGFFMLFMGLFLAWTTWSIYRSISQKQIFQHPVFQPDCYHSGGVERREGRQTQLSNQQEAPAQRPMQRPSGSTKKTNNKNLPHNSSNSPRKASRGSSKSDVETGNMKKSNKRPSTTQKKKGPPKQSMAKKKKPTKNKSPNIV